MAVSRKTVYNKTACHLLLSIWINKTTGKVWQRVLCWIFIVGPDYFLISRFSSESVLFFACNLLICLKQKLPLHATEFFFATLVIKKLTADLLIIFVTFTWFYKIENVVMWQVEID